MRGHRPFREGSRRVRVGLVTLGLLALTAGAAAADHLLIDTDSHTTLEQKLEGDGANFESLSSTAAGEAYTVRDGDEAIIDDAVQAQAGRDDRRVSLAYFSQLTDFQLADEESPARVEFLDPGASSAHRPQEAFHPFVIDASIRQVNRFQPSSPVPQGDQLGNAGNVMDFALITGDQADNMQRNEVVWTRELLEGGTPLNVNSGVTDPAFYATPAFLTRPSCPGLLVQEVAQNGGMGDPATLAAAEAAGYTGIQDYDDYPAGMPPGPQPAYYDPDDPQGQFSDWPMWTGLMDRAQMTFTPQGLNVPSYWSNGNHDALVQGNEDGNAAFEDIATACFKALGTTLQLPPSQPGPDFSPDPNVLLAPTAIGMLVPPDPLRRFVDRPQIKDILGEDGEDNAHGFDFVPPAEDAASNGNASYYAWDPPETPGFRFINIDTNSEGGQTAEGVASGSSNGNIDDPQFQWLEGELEDAQAADKLIVIFGHHPVRSLSTVIVDEQASPCTTNDTHGDTPEHDVNPGCDRDPRNSAPSGQMHLGPDFVELLSNYDNVLAYVAGHTHEHKLLPCGLASGCGANPLWWEINTAATADWPQQHRLIDIMDNRDGTLSIFGTALDHASDSTSPPAGSAAAFDYNKLASIGRTLSFNDPQGGPPSGEGQLNDRNAELLLKDPRDANLRVVKIDTPDPVQVGQPLTYTVTVENSGPSTATATTLTDHLPATTSFGSAIPDQGTCAPPAGGDVVCALGDIAAGADAQVVITVTPNTATLPDEPLVNRAEVESVLHDPNTDNNAAETETTVNPLPGLFGDLDIDKTASPTSLLAGLQLTYNLTVRNDGPDDAPNVAVLDELPKSVTLNAAIPSTGTCVSFQPSGEGVEVTCLLGTLDDGDTATIQITVTPTSAGTIVNEASVASGIGDGDLNDNRATASVLVTAPPSTPGQGTNPGNCDNRAPTIPGTTGNDVLTGTPGPDVISAGLGRDRVNGRGGDDLICGGDANDKLRGGSGDDRLFGLAGGDRLLGKSGDDDLFGGKGRDRLKGGKGLDSCAGGKGRDLIFPSCDSRSRTRRG